MTGNVSPHGRSLDDKRAVPRNPAGDRRNGQRNLMAVEMEAAALCAFAQVRQKPVLYFAPVANRMGCVDGDFEKGEAAGGHDALALIAIAADSLRFRLLP
jgi:nucleoside phosphorylase